MHILIANHQHEGETANLGGTGTTSKVYCATAQDAWTTSNLTWSAAIVCDNPAHKITGMQAYGNPQIPYILKEDCIGNISDNLYARIPQDEMGAVSSEYNGRASCQYGVYLFFSLLQGVERYYENKMDDIGPNRGTGFPDSGIYKRQGISNTC